ncbi:MAG: 50S ribosomal protein L24 [Lentisphaeria bacterium]
MARARIKKEMMVTVIAGEDVGSTGKVLEVDTKNDRVLVEGINVRRKAMRRTPDKPQGGIVDQEASIHISNVMPEDEYRQRRGQPVADKEQNKEEGEE